MKNCPWFSLRSNSIELRFRSVRGAIFKLIPGINHQEKKKLGIRFAHQFFILASLDLDTNRFNSSHYF